MRDPKFISTSHPQLSIRSFPGHIEFRVSRHVSQQHRGATSRHIGSTAFDSLTVAAFAWIWYQCRDERLHVLLLLAVVMIYAVWRCTGITFESLILLPPHGVQLETHRGFAGLSLLVSKRFVPMIYLRDVLINEALYGWNVRYYVAILSSSADGFYRLDVAFENILPQFPLLAEVQRLLKDRIIAGD